MWRELCSRTREKLTDPYLRAAFAFLTSETESHDAVLVNIVVINYNIIMVVSHC